MSDDKEVVRLRAEVERLRKREALLTAAIEASPTGILIASAEAGRIVVSNAAATSMFTDDDGSLASEKPWRLYREDGSQYSLEATPLFRALFQGETIRGEKVIFEHNSGWRAWTEGNAAPVLDDQGNIVAACLVIVDVTERVAIEQEAERFRLMVATSPDFVGIATPDGKTLYVNAGGLAMCGLPADADVRGEPIAIYHPPAQAERVRREGMPAAVRDGAWFAETALRTRSGEDIPVSQLLMAHRDAEGHVTHFSTVMRDLREVRRLEAQLLHSQKLEALGRLAGGIAHDFNNMLFVINNYVAMVMESLPEGQERQDLKLALDAAERATTLCSQLLGFARRQVISPKVVCLNELLRQFERFLRQVLGENIELDVMLAPDLWNVRIDPAQFDQIITNLSVNARDAQPQGGRLIIETENIVLDEDYVATSPELTPGRYALVAVSDHGPGMSPEVLEHAFEPFFSTKERGKGTGLGLATVHGAVKQNGGHVTAYSELGRGTTIKVYLPAVDEALEVAVSPISGRRAMAKETVLVVEDEGLVRDLTVRLLESAGFRVLSAESGPHAVEVSKAFDGPIHLLISDVIMPKMSGPELAEAITNARPDTKVLFVSGYTDQAIVQHGVLSRGVEFLSKPFGREKLLGRVRALLHSKVR